MVEISIYVDARSIIQSQRETPEQAYERSRERLESISKDSMLVGAAQFWRAPVVKRYSWNSIGRGGISVRRA